jgi:hypothetical protein
VPDRKGLKTLEPYEGKLSSTVPRRGEAGNASSYPTKTDSASNVGLSVVSYGH